MPCSHSAHIHDWKSSGTLVIAKCESRCGFCDSGKDYKPASALRKHVARHIKNDHMKLRLASVNGGRPKLFLKSSLNGTASGVAIPDPSLASPMDYNSGPDHLPSLEQYPSRGKLSVTPDADTSPYPALPAAKLNDHDSPVLPATPEVQYISRSSEALYLSVPPGLPAPADNAHPSRSALLILPNRAFFALNHELRWRSGDGKTIFIDLEPPKNRQDFANSQICDSVRSVAELRAHSTWLLLQSVPYLPLCFGREQLNDPRSHMWRGIAADIVNAAAFYSTRKTQVLGYPEDIVISLGLSCLSTALSILLAIQGVFSEYEYGTISKPDVFRRTMSSSYIIHLNSRLEKFLQAMEQVVSHVAFVDKLARHLTIIYGVLILFLVRCVLRSAFQCAQHGFSAIQDQGAQNPNLQDPSFAQGSQCPIYQLYLAALRDRAPHLPRHGQAMRPKIRKACGFTHSVNALENF